MPTIKEVKEHLAMIDELDHPLFEELILDGRAGVQAAISKRKRELQKQVDEDLRLEKMLAYEKELYTQGIQLIAVILPKACKIPGLNDSKKIPKSKHKEIYEAVLQNAIAIGIGIKDNQVIDQVNIYEATKLAMMEAIGQLEPQPQHLLIDAMKLDLPIPQTSIIKGDANSLSIAAASIVAKVTRDQMMEKFDREYPGYDFAQNAGYGTAKHLAGLDQLGVTPIHRRSFEPVKSMCED